MYKALINDINLFLKIKSCNIYVYVYSQTIYNNVLEINILNWYNIFTSENLKITILIEV
jgi:hypothetical protein